MNKLLWFLCLLLGLGMCSQKLIAEPGKITQISVAYPESTDLEDPAFYYQRVLKLALEKTRITDGDYRLHFSIDFFSLNRATNMLVNNNNADVMWGSVTAERQNVVEVIPYDLLRGLNNYRVLVIRPDSQEKFDHVHDFPEFKKLISGGGSNWTATNIQRLNGIKVNTAPKYESILKMLAAGRFDYISRGLHEVQTDINLSKTLGLGLAVESGILLKYKHAIDYSFFVNKQNFQLADRLKRGLAIADNDGSLIAEFNNMKVLQRASAYLHQGRRVFVLDNQSIRSLPSRKLPVNPQ